MLDPSTQSIALYVNKATVFALLTSTPTYDGDTGWLSDDVNAMWDEGIFLHLNRNDDAYLTVNPVSAVKGVLTDAESLFSLFMATYAAAARTRLIKAFDQVPWDDDQLLDIG